MKKKYLLFLFLSPFSTILASDGGDPPATPGTANATAVVIASNNNGGDGEASTRDIVNAELVKSSPLAVFQKFVDENPVKQSQEDYRACNNGEQISLFLKIQADLQSEQLTSEDLHALVKQGYEAGVMAKFIVGEVKFKHNRTQQPLVVPVKTTLLQEACQHADVATVLHILAAGGAATVNDQNENLETALHLAVYAALRDTEMIPAVQALLDAKARPKIPSREGDSAIKALTVGIRTKSRGSKGEQGHLGELEALLKLMGPQKQARRRYKQNPTVVSKGTAAWVAGAIWNTGRSALTVVGQAAGLVAKTEDETK